MKVIAHLCSETEFLGLLNTFRLHRLIWYSRPVQTILFYLSNQTTAHRTDLLGCTVSNLWKLWVCKLSYLKRHPLIQKGKKGNNAYFCSKKRKLLPLNHPRLVRPLTTECRMNPNSILSMVLRQTRVVLVIKDCSKQLMRLWAIALILANRVAFALVYLGSGGELCGVSAPPEFGVLGCTCTSPSHSTYQSYRSYCIVFSFYSRTQVPVFWTSHYWCASQVLALVHDSRLN
jgi:hypothetical protein